MAAPVTGLVTDAIRNSESRRTGAPPTVSEPSAVDVHLIPPGDQCHQAGHRLVRATCAAAIASNRREAVRGQQIRHG